MGAIVAAGSRQGLYSDIKLALAVAAGTGEYMPVP